MSVADRKIAYLMEHVRRLGAGVRALQTVALKYGQHTADCDRCLPELDTQCSCDWETTRQTIEEGMQEPQKVTP